MFALVTLLYSLLAAGQQSSLRVEVRADDRPIAGATVTIAGTSYPTDASGVVVAAVSSGAVRIESPSTAT